MHVWLNSEATFPSLLNMKTSQNASLPQNQRISLLQDLDFMVVSRSAVLVILRSVFCTLKTPSQTQQALAPIPRSHRFFGPSLSKPQPRIFQH